MYHVSLINQQGLINTFLFGEQRLHSIKDFIFFKRIVMILGEELSLLSS